MNVARLIDSLPCCIIEIRGLAWSPFKSTGIVSLIQVMVGKGSPPASQTNKAFLPKYCTFMPGFWMMKGKPLGICLPWKVKVNTFLPRRKCK